jgi:hypothetical protein
MRVRTGSLEMLDLDYLRCTGLVIPAFWERFYVCGDLGMDRKGGSVHAIQNSTRKIIELILYYKYGTKLLTLTAVLRQT